MKLGQSLLAANNRNILLQSCPICSGLGDDSLVSIARIARDRVFAKNESIMREGDVSTGFFLVLSGRVRVFKSAADGKEKVLLVAELGMTFGEDALFGEGVFLENAVATEEARVLQIPKSEFLEVLRRNSELCFQVMESLCAWARRLSSSVESVVFLGARQRVARYLLGLSTGSTDGVVMPEKKKDAADRIGIAPETFSRAIHEFEKLGILRIERRKIGILDSGALEDVANGHS